MKGINHILIPLSLILIISCNSSQKNQTIDSLTSKSASKAIKHNTNQSKDTISIGDDTPSQEEEIKRLSETYNIVERIDSTFINENDTLHFHLKYYCLKNINLVVPKYYIYAKKEFITHPFATDILLINNKDTIINEQFKASDFNPYFVDNFEGALKKYGSIHMPDVFKNPNDKSKIIINFSLSIPATDLGTGLYLIISKNGDYKIAEDF